jgi:hypothetical protein
VPSYSREALDLVYDYSPDFILMDIQIRGNLDVEATTMLNMGDH